MGLVLVIQLAKTVSHSVMCSGFRLLNLLVHPTYNNETSSSLYFITQHTSIM